MRKALLLSSFLCGLFFFPKEAVGQFNVLPDSDAVWIFHAYDPWDIDYYEAYTLYPTVHDTIINDTTYKALLCCDASTGWPTSFCGGIYNSESGEVFYYHPNTDHSYVLYDFSVLVGDSVENVWVGSASQPIALLQTMYVASVDTIVIAGSPRKRIGIQSWAAIVGAQDIVHWWIQGIGGTNGLLETSGNLTLDMTTGLECMSFNDTVWWSWGPNGSPGNCFNVGMNELSGEYQPWFFPSIVQDEIRLLPSIGSGAYWEIFSLDGRSVERTTAQGTVLSIASLPPGPYLIRLLDVDLGILRVGRFVKE